MENIIAIVLLALEATLISRVYVVGVVHAERGAGGPTSWGQLAGGAAVIFVGIIIGALILAFVVGN